MTHSDKENTASKAPGYLGYTLAELQTLGALHTAREIAGQPQLWLDTWQQVSQERPGLQAFLDQACAHPDLEVVLTGAGTSAFIGDILEGPFQKNLGRRTRAVATTQLVAHPEHYLQAQVPTLLVSFARSGNSPESVAAVALADQLCQQVFHLIITCNPEGNLAHYPGWRPTLVFHLPPAANDQALAMTGSFSAMLLSGLLLARLPELETLQSKLKQLAAYGQSLLAGYEKLQQIASLNFERAIFLGSGPLQGTARESGLKLQELTDGRIICKHDSFLGFRHGPRAVTNAATLLVYLFSNQDYVQQYERDLVQSLSQDKVVFRLGVMESAALQSPAGVDLMLTFPGGSSLLEEDFLPVCFVLPAQLLGFFKSLQLQLQPDAPSASNAITRVVQGVSIYPFAQSPEQPDPVVASSPNPLLL